MQISETIQIGNYTTNKGLFPTKLPLKNFKGLCVDTKSCGVSLVHTQFEYIILAQMVLLPSLAIKISVIDIGLNTSFPLLKKMSLVAPNIRFIHKTDEVKPTLTSLFQDARHIADTILVDFPDLHTYNSQSPYPEPFHWIVIANFPHHFREEEAKELLTLIKYGAKAGIFTLMSFDKSKIEIPAEKSYWTDRHEVFREFPKELWYLHKKPNGKYAIENLYVKIIDDFFSGYDFSFQKYSPEYISKTLNQLTKKYMENYKNGLKDAICIPIGRAGNRDFFLELGAKSGVYHSIIGGQSGTGKSTFLRNIITQLAIDYSSDELRLYLLDYKFGKEAEIFKNHPNVEFLLLDRTNSHFEIAFEVLTDFEQQIENRYKLFSSEGSHIMNYTDYNQSAKQPLPTLLLIIDEANLLFSRYGDIDFFNKISKKLVNVAQRGRAAGVLLMLCGQQFDEGVRSIDTITQEIQLGISFRLPKNYQTITGSGGIDTTKTLRDFEFWYNPRRGNEETSKKAFSSNLPAQEVENLLEIARKKHKPKYSFTRKIIDTKELQKEPIQTEEKNKKKANPDNDFSIVF